MQSWSQSHIEDVGRHNPFRKKERCRIRREHVKYSPGKQLLCARACDNAGGRFERSAGQRRLFVDLLYLITGMAGQAGLWRVDQRKEISGHFGRNRLP